MTTKFTVCNSYARFSPRPDADKSVSNQQQHYLVQQWCLDHNLPPPKELFEDKAKSRDDLNRPGLWECVKATEGGLMVAYALDRVGDVLAIETVVRALEKQKSVLATVVEGVQANDPDSEFVRIIKGGLSRQQKRQMAARTQAAIRARMAAGECMSSKAPAGFKFIPGGQAKTNRGAPRRMMVPDIAELRQIKHFQELARDLMCGVKALKTFLNRKGVVVRGGEVKFGWLEAALKLDWKKPSPYGGYILGDVMASASDPQP